MLKEHSFSIKLEKIAWFGPENLSLKQLFCVYGENSTKFVKTTGLALLFYSIKVN